MRLLIVEDDKTIREFLAHSLEAEFFAVDTASDGEKGSYLARVNEYDLILLDNSLPKKDGLTICQELRAAQKNMPIMIVSVRSELPEKVGLLREGADDYVTKPFSMDEIVARVRALLRRPKIVEKQIYTVDDLTLDSNSHQVLRAGNRIYFTRKEFVLLEYLMRNKGMVVSRSMIMEHVWENDSNPFSNTIEAHIGNLRKKLATDSNPYIYTIPGKGYKIADKE